MLQFLQENQRYLSNEPQSSILYNTFTGTSTSSDSKCAKIIRDKYQRLLIGFYTFGQMHGGHAYITRNGGRKQRKWPDGAYLKCMHCEKIVNALNRLEQHHTMQHDGEQMQTNPRSNNY